MCMVISRCINVNSSEKPSRKPKTNFAKFFSQKSLKNMESLMYAPDNGPSFFDPLFCLVYTCEMFDLARV